MEKMAAKPSSAMQSSKRTAIDGMFVALTLIFTAFVNIQIPSFGGAGGLIHLGNVPLLIAAILYGRRTGAIAGGLGMGLFDLLSGWVAWMPCTVITCGLMGYVVGAICEKKKNILIRIFAVSVALVIKVLGYFVFESYILGNGAVAAVRSVPGNVIQVVLAAIIVGIIIVPLEKGIRFLEK